MVVLAAVVAGVLMMGGRAVAHDETVSSSDVVVEGAGVVWRVDVGVAGVGKVVHLAEPVTERELADAKAGIAAYLLHGLAVTLDGRLAAADVGDLEPRYEQGVLARAVLTVRFSSARPIETLRCRIAFFGDLTRQHRAVVTVRWGGGVRQFVRLGPAELELRAAEFAQGRAAVVREFLLWGTEHIFLGYDHIAFLLALLLVAAGWAELLKIVTAFTVAHSLTLLLSALDVVRIPSRTTEILIAASIVYVAVENLVLLARRREPRQRWALTFAFGLVHGLGFATELRHRLASVPGGVLLPVLSFNLGVELGQMAIVVAVFPLFAAARRAGEARRVLLVRWGSATIGMLGLVWMIERVVS